MLLVFAAFYRPNYSEEIHIDENTATSTDSNSDSSESPTPSAICIERTVVYPAKTEMVNLHGVAKSCDVVGNTYMVII